MYETSECQIDKAIDCLRFAQQKQKREIEKKDNQIKRLEHEMENLKREMDENMKMSENQIREMSNQLNSYQRQASSRENEKERIMVENCELSDENRILNNTITHLKIDLEKAHHIIRNLIKRNQKQVPLL